MSDEQTKQCSRCKETKPLAHFYYNKAARDGLRGDCKECVKATVARTDKAYKARRGIEYARENSRRHKQRHQAKYTEKQREWRVDSPLKYKAHNRAGKAIRLGKLQRPKECERCGAMGRIEGHHPDYTKPLEIQWLCSRCHMKEHGTCVNAAIN